MSIGPKDSEFSTSVVPNLSVRRGISAVEFYKKAFGATELSRITAPGGAIVAEMAIDGARFFVADESPEHQNFSPESLGGTSVRIDLVVADPDAMQKRAIQAGATEISPVADKTFGFRMGRVADPFGHHWLIARPLATPRRGRQAARMTD
jgi:PhnB protein